RVVRNELGPRDDEVAGGIGTDVDAVLVSRRRCVDRELSSERRPGRVEEAADGPGVVAVLSVRAPDDDETGCRTDVGDRRGILKTRRRRIDQELRAEGGSLGAGERSGCEENEQSGVQLPRGPSP